MNFTFENQGTTTYLVYSIRNEDVIDSMSLGMLTNNHIPGLASTLFTQMDETKYLKYNVSSKVSVNQFFMGQVNKKRLIGVFKGIVDAMLSSEEYMLDVQSILLDMEYIFTDVSTCETTLICIPIQKENNEAMDLSAFFKKIMFSTQFDQSENCEYIAKIINYLNMAPTLSLENFGKLLDELSKPAVQPSVQPSVSVQPSIQSKPVQQSQPVQQPQMEVPKKVSQQIEQPQKPLQQMVQPNITVQNAGNEKNMSMMNLLMHYNKENAQLYKEQKAAKKNMQNNKKMIKNGTSGADVNFAIPGQPLPEQTVNSEQKEVQKIPNTTFYEQNQTRPYVQEQPQVHSANFGETTVLSGGNIGETTVLGVSAMCVEPKPYLVRMKNNENIPLDKPIFRIGKEKSYVDYFIGDNTAISRSHANIISRDGEYFVVDTNSTNHTYLNGQMLASNVEMKIVNGAKIRLANEDFEFKLQ